MPRSQVENERIKEEKVERILMSALTVFAENGLAAAKMSDIAKAAGVSYGLVYNYFSSKEEIFIKLLNNIFSLSYEFVDEIKSMQLSPLERIKEIFIQLFNFHSSDSKGRLYYRIMLELNFYPHLWEKLIVKGYDSEPVFQFLLETIEEGQQKGEFVDKNFQEIVLILSYIASSFSLNSLEIFNGIKSESIVDLIVRMIKK